MSDWGLSPVEKGALEKFTKNLYSKKCCLHPQAPAGCNGKIIRAHSIPKRSGLKRIAKNGKVYSFSYLVTASIRGENLYQPKQIGIEDASTFTGFCRSHDNKIFEPIE